MKDLYLYCLDKEGANATDTTILQCISTSLTTEFDKQQVAQMGISLVYAGALAFFMQAGFGMLCAGSVRKKNVQNTMLKNLLDACSGAVAYFCVGYGLAFGNNDPESATKSFIGTSNFFLMGDVVYGFWFYQYCFVAASTTIVAGTLAERCQMGSYLAYSLLISGWVYPIISRAMWCPNGILSASNIEPFGGVGCIDFAGSGVVHVTGGTVALLATTILGPRRGRFHDGLGQRLDKPCEIRGHSVALQMLGTFVLWFGWYGFNTGNALLNQNPTTGYTIAALAATNTTIAAGMGSLTAILLHLWYLHRSTGKGYFEVKYAMNGALAGLVAITAGCGVVEPWAALVIGFIAGGLYLIGSSALVVLCLDDAVDAIPVHLLCGIWGLLAVGLFASPKRLDMQFGRSNHPGLFYSIQNGDTVDARLLGVQCLGMVFIIGWVTVFMLPFFIWLDWNGWFRSDPLEEIFGLDVSYHDALEDNAGLLDNRGQQERTNLQQEVEGAEGATLMSSVLESLTKRSGRISSVDESEETSERETR